MKCRCFLTRSICQPPSCGSCGPTCCIRSVKNFSVSGQVEGRVDLAMSPMGTLNHLNTWNSKQPVFYGCFNWMIQHLYMGNGCLTKHPLKTGCLGFQVCAMVMVQPVALAIGDKRDRAPPSMTSMTGILISWGLINPVPELGPTFNDRNPYNGYINPYGLGLMSLSPIIWKCHGS